ncbi:hypothetical protein MLD38_029443 [Melastoma candidum]|uniref:Uncharacterized protein n=1 Tax=Melastoma candidum TaxID=119954 RepID=A0ACB9N686_9MYRT|nr:hypothetical protein MLD38_029443 [Melastoma candidum]
MPVYNIRGIDVDFPFEAYDCQLVYMEKVIQSLQQRCNALLESPTGTGKTLCLLCATLAWRKSLGGFSTGRMRSVTSSSQEEPSSQSGSSQPSQSNRSQLPTIVYTTRTHSQLRQVIQELRRSNYRPKMMVLGSREQLCIHDKVSLIRGRAQNNACQFVCRKKAKHRCQHFTRVTDYLNQNPFLGDEPVDIEDLVDIGRKSGPCPYFLSRELRKSVDILFAPYNYLIDNGYRRSLGLDWVNSVIIFDEAHNLESLCADAASFDMPSGLLTACISEARDCVDLTVKRRFQSNDKSQNPENFAILRALLLKLEERIAEIPIESKELGFTKPGPYIYELFSELNINQDTASMLISTIEGATVLLEESKQMVADNNMCRLETMGDIFKLLFKDKDLSHAQFYRLHVREVEAHDSDGVKVKASRTLSWWCFNPGIAMQEFSKIGVGSVVLTSGTLSPLDSFAHELNLEFPVRLENPHVISLNQLWAGVVPLGPSGYSFNSSYRNRDSLEYKQELGNAIVNFARIVPDGLLVFFSSYYILDQCIKCWKNVNSVDSNSIWERICKHKRPVVEPRQSSLFPLAIEDYMTKLKDTSSSGAVFFAVCRGKVSEGLDFADHAGRAVVITGLPFATRNDPKVRLKREYLDEQAYYKKEGTKVLSGEEWYNQQASRAVNQAVGRVIRHRDDYGAIIFCDERFSQASRQSQISRWIQPHIKCYNKFGDVVFTLARFFRDGGRHAPTRLKMVECKNRGEQKATEPLDCCPSSLDHIKSKEREEVISSSCDARKEESCSIRLGEVLPANRATLDANKMFTGAAWTPSDHGFFNRKKFLVPGVSNVLNKCEIVDLADDAPCISKPSNEIVALSSSKKRKVLPSLVPNLRNLPEVSVGPRDPWPANSLSSSCSLEAVDSPFDGRCRDAHSSVVLSSLANENIQRSDANTVLLKNATEPGPKKDDETKGAAFLMQVQAILSPSEYKEFVGFMKALKSKAMKLGFVLQSIAKLFSGPERLPLSERFKDFIPPKYHLLYEKYLGEMKE